MGRPFVITLRIQAGRAGLTRQAWPVEGWVVIFVWTAGLTALAVMAYRRDTGKWQLLKGRAAVGVNPLRTPLLGASPVSRPGPSFSVGGSSLGAF